jgi:hypothetical protein
MSQTAIRPGDLVVVVQGSSAKALPFGATLASVQALVTVEDTEYAILNTGNIASIYPLVNVRVVQTRDERNKYEGGLR